MKRIAAIHDISGFGKCSLTVAIPIISAAGLECMPVPTAVLSTHTGEFTGYTFRDLTDDLMPFAMHWRDLGLKLDAIYTGFMGSSEQINIVTDIVALFKTKSCMVFVDPVLGDYGKLYSIYDDSMCEKMKGFIRHADVIVPNMTEAAFLLDMPYKEAPYKKDYIKDIMIELSDMGPTTVVLTGIAFDSKGLGAAYYDSRSGDFGYYVSKKIKGSFHGTGDVFGSVLLSALQRDLSLKAGVRAAVLFTKDAIELTKGKLPREGVDFELLLKDIDDYIVDTSCL